MGSSALHESLRFVQLSGMSPPPVRGSHTFKKTNTKSRPGRPRLHETSPKLCSLLVCFFFLCDLLPAQTVSVKPTCNRNALRKFRYLVHLPASLIMIPRCRNKRHFDNFGCDSAVSATALILAGMLSGAYYASTPALCPQNIQPIDKSQRFTPTSAHENRSLCNTTARSPSKARLRPCASSTISNMQLGTIARADACAPRPAHRPCVFNVPPNVRRAHNLERARARRVKIQPPT